MLDCGITTSGVFNIDGRTIDELDELVVQQVLKVAGLTSATDLFYNYKYPFRLSIRPSICPFCGL